MNDYIKKSFDLFGKRNVPVAEASRAHLLADFTPEEVSGLLRVRSAVGLGEFSENTQEVKRLMFARWLIEHGRLDD